MPIDVQVLRERAAAIEIEAERLALQPLLTREECDIASTALRAALPSGSRGRRGSIG